MYQIIVAWDDCSCKTERTDDIRAALRTVEIYLADSHICDVHIYDCIKKQDVFNWPLQAAIFFG